MAIFLFSYLFKQGFKKSICLIKNRVIFIMSSLYKSIFQL